MNTEIAKQESGFDIQYFSEHITSAPEVLVQSKESLSKAKRAASGLIENKKAVGMSDALDEQMKSYAEKAKRTVKMLNENRKPFTQLIDAIKKEFTSIESELTDEIKVIEGLRDEYAAEKAKKAKVEAERIAREQAINQEKITVRKNAEMDLADKFSKYVGGCKAYLLAKLNNATLDTIESVKLYLDTKGCSITPEKLYQEVGSKVLVSSHILDNDTITAIVKEVLEEKTFSYCEVFRQDISLYRKEVLDMCDSKVQQLREIAKAEAEADQKKIEELKRQEQELEDAKKREIEASSTQFAQQGARQAAVNSTEAATAAIIDSQAALFVPDTSNIKEGCKIKILNKGAYILIAQFWFVNEGKDWTDDKIEKMTFKRMVEYAEKVARDSEMKIDSEFVKYETVYKAK